MDEREQHDRQEEDDRNGGTGHQAIFPCLQYRGSGPGCASCPIFQQGYCREWCKTLPYLERNLRRKYPARSADTAITDILQDTFLSVHKGLETFQQGSAFSTWVETICNHKHFDHVRRQRKDRVSIPQPVPCVPDGLTALCQKWRSDLLFYPSKKTGYVEVVAVSLPQTLVVSLQSLSPQPSWQKMVQRLRTKRRIDLSLHHPVAALQECCMRSPRALRYHSLEPTGTLYALSPPLRTELRDELLALSDREDWRQAILALEQQAREQTPIVRISIDTDGPGDEEGGGMEIPDPANRIQSLEDRLALDQIIALIEQLDAVCGQFIRDLLRIEWNNEGSTTQADQALALGLSYAAFRQRKSRCKKKLFLHPDHAMNLILPKDRLCVREVEPQEPSGFLWCILENGTRIRSEKKLSAAEVALVRDLCTKGQPIRITGVRGTKSGSTFFPVYDIPGGTAC